MFERETPEPGKTRVVAQCRDADFERLVRSTFGMDGKVELAPVDAGVTRLTVSGMYEPPLGAVGKKLDEVLLRNVAQATVRELAESIAKRLDAALASRGE